MEPNLAAKVKLDAKGAGTLTVRVIPDHHPDHPEETHSFVFPVDQSYLPSVIDQLTAIIKKHGISWRIFW
jgi:hypothetical protein